MVMTNTFAQNETAQLPPPSPPVGKYPYTSKIFSTFFAGRSVHPNEIVPATIDVTNNADFPLFDLNAGVSFNDSKYLKLYDLHKIDFLEPNETKRISAQLYVSPNVKPYDYNDIW